MYVTVLILQAERQLKIKQHASIYSHYGSVYVTHPGRKTAVTTCAFTKDGKLIAGAMIDGSIQLWKSTGPFVCQLPSHSAFPFHCFLPFYLDISPQTWCHLGRSDTVVRCALMNISRSKKPLIQQLKMLCGKDHDGFREGFMMLKVSHHSEVTLHAFVTSKPHLCGC